MKKNRNVIIIAPLLILVIVVAAFIIFIKKHENRMATALTLEQYNNGPQAPISEWKTYTNNKYGFSIKYPSEGYVQDPICYSGKPCEGVNLAACGSDIKVENWTKSSNFIQIDNMLGIIINNYDGPINTFIKSQGGNPANFEVQTEGVKGADGAEFITLKTNNDPNWSPPVPSISTPVYIVKKGDYIFQIGQLQNTGSKIGCLAPAGTRGNTFQSKYWDIPESISFN